MDAALEALRNHNMSLTKASGKKKIYISIVVNVYLPTIIRKIIRNLTLD